MRAIETKKLLRVLDANFNRAREGLRVCEDVCRFFFNDTAVTRGFKDIRHGLTSVMKDLSVKDLLAARDIVGDVGRGTTALEARRSDGRDVFLANVQRVKESLRVLEEFGKILAPRSAERLKRLRYRLYDLERSAGLRMLRTRAKR